MTGERPQPAGTHPGGGAVLRFLAVLSLAVALAIPLLSFACLFPLVENMPTWDQWSLIELWSAHYEGRPVLPVLLKPYNGHLNLVPRLIFFGMGVLSHWDVRLDIVASYLAACGTLTLLLLLACRGGRQGLLLAAPISAQVFSFQQYENFVSGYPFGQNLSQLLSTLAIFLLSLPRLGRRAFLGAAAATAAATFSWGAGLAGWYVGLVALLLRRERSRWRLGVWLALTLLSTAAVKAGSAGSFRPIDWKHLVPFFLALLGKAWAPSAFPSVDQTIFLGAAALLAFAALAGWVLLRRLWPEMLPWLLLGLSALASAGLISLGRSGEGLDQALASHYVTAAYPLVVACTAILFFVLLATAERARLKSVWRGLALAAAVLPVLQATAVSYRWLPVLRSWAAIIHHNTREIARGTATDEAIRTSHHPDPQVVRQGVEVMRKNRLSWFHEALDGEPPSGNVDRIAGQTADRRPLVIAVDEPWKIEGWAVRSRRQGGEVKAVHLFIDGRRIASAELDLPRSDVMEFFHSSRYLSSGWVISVPAAAVPEGTHRLWVAAADYNDGLFILLETDLVARGRSSRPAGEQRELGAAGGQEAPLPPQHAVGQRP
ncbi:MAG: hypothetical protein ACJ76N_06680 [Thermoanaerobaculia bacterium]